MNREINFRVWIKPSSWNEEDDEGFMTNGLPLDGWKNWWLNLDEPFKEGYSLDGVFKVGRDIEIMQYTGLKDKNGKDIYEGDIVRVCNNNNGYFEVKFKNQYVGGWVLCVEGEEDLSLGARQKQDIEVIGNIYENKELLTNKK